MTLVSCKMKGDLDVNEEITLLKKKSIFSSKMKKVTIPAGNYKAALKASSKKKIKFKIEGVDKKSYTFPFKIQETTKVPEWDGEVVIKGTETGQAYDLKVVVDTDVSSNTYDTTESCISGYRTETRCHWVSSHESCSTSGGGRVCVTRRNGQEVCADQPSRTTCHTVPGHNVCRQESIPIYGSQEVTYRSTTTTKNLIANLLEGQNIMAKFDHSDTNSSRSQIGSGPCY